MEEELSLPFIVWNKYYKDEEERMVACYMSKTRLSSMLKKSKEDETFEKLIWSVGRMKVLWIVLANVYKELQAGKKISQTNLKEIGKIDVANPRA